MGRLAKAPSPLQRCSSALRRRCASGLTYSRSSWRVRARAEAEGKMTMRALVILAAVCFSTSAYAQDAPPKVGNKPLAQVKPKEPMGCKLVGTVKGTKLWAGDCVGSELRGATPATETESLPEKGPPDQSR